MTTQILSRIRWQTGTRAIAEEALLCLRRRPTATLAWLCATLCATAGCTAAVSDDTPAARVSETSLPGTIESAMCRALMRPVVMVSSRGANSVVSQLFLMTPDAEELERLTEDGGYRDPVWSPDGRKIAFRRHTTAARDSKSSEVGILAADTGERVVVTREDELPADVTNASFSTDGPSWSPDGRSLAFASTRDTGYPRVWLSSVSGGQQEPLLQDLSAPNHSPAWARHDATSIAYVAEVDGSEDIWVTDISTKENRVNLTLGLVQNPRRLRWSPDGERIAFVASDDTLGAGDDEVYIIDLATLTLQQVTDNDALDTDPAWSPDGTSLLIASNRTALALGGPPTLTALRALWSVPIEAPERAVELTAAGGDSSQPDWFWGPACGAR